MFYPEVPNAPSTPERGVASSAGFGYPFSLTLNEWPVYTLFY